MEKKLEIKNVNYIYSKDTPFATAALKDVSCTFYSGQITGLIGHTGSGKSTLVQMLNGLLRPSSGKVLLDGMDIWEEPKEISRVRFRVGLVFQYPEYQLFEETVFADIAFGPKNMGLDEESVKKRVLDAAAIAGVEKEWFDKSPFDLSGGQKRRVAIAGVMAMEPEVLVLDEPAAGLDPVGKEKIFRAVTNYRHEKNSSVIIVSHSMEDMAKYADRLIVMNNSSVVLEDTPDRVFTQSRMLCEIGLDVPQITKMLLELKKLGVPARTDIFTVDAAREELENLLGGERKC